MSRIGKKPIELPPGVKVELKGRSIEVKGPKGALVRELPPHSEVKVEGAEINVIRAGEPRRFGAFQGLTRALLANMVTGVSEGFHKSMSLVGVGYKVQLQGNSLVFNLGLSHPVEFPLPDGITAEVGEKGIEFKIMGIDRELVGQTCATIRSFRPPEPYKGKGIRHAGEMIRQKAGKAAVK